MSEATLEPKSVALEDLSDKLDLLLARATERWPQYFGIPEAASYSTLSQKTIRRMVDSGQIVPCRVRGRLLIPRVEMDSVILAAREGKR